MYVSIPLVLPHLDGSMLVKERLISDDESRPWLQFCNGFPCWSMLGIYVIDARKNLKPSVGANVGPVRQSATQHQYTF